MAQQLREATPHGDRPRYLVCDNDGKYGGKFDALAVASGIEMVRIPPRSPNLNPIFERFLGSVRRECLDHIVILGRCYARWRSAHAAAPSRLTIEGPRLGKNLTPFSRVPTRPEGGGRLPRDTMSCMREHGMKIRATRKSSRRLIARVGSWSRSTRTSENWLLSAVILTRVLSDWWESPRGAKVLSATRSFSNMKPCCRTARSSRLSRLACEYGCRPTITRNEGFACLLRTPYLAVLYRRRSHVTGPSTMTARRRHVDRSRSREYGASRSKRRSRPWPR